MTRRTYIFLIVCTSLLIMILVKFGYIGRFLDWYDCRIYEGENNEGEKNPEYIYETFIDKDGNEVVLEMRKRIGTVDGKEVVFYEETAGADVIYCHFYKGTVKSVSSDKIVFIVDKECKNANLEDLYFDYIDVKDYEIEFNLSEYDLDADEKFGICDRVAVNSDAINSDNDLEILIGKYVRVQDSEFRDNATKIIHKGLDFYVK